RHVYYRTNETSLGRKATDTPGWSPTPENQRALLESYKQGLMTGQLSDLSRHSVNEARQYVHTKEGSVAHSAGLRTIDPSGAKKNHGDRVMATALAWWPCRRAAGFESAEEQEQGHPQHSFGGRRQQYERDERLKKRPNYSFLRQGGYEYTRR